MHIDRSPSISCTTRHILALSALFAVVFVSWSAPSVALVCPLFEAIGVGCNCCTLCNSASNSESGSEHPTLWEWGSVPSRCPVPPISMCRALFTVGPNLPSATTLARHSRKYPKQISVPSEELLRAIAKVESNNDPNAVGDDGKAIGIFQIRWEYWKDAVDYDYGETQRRGCGCIRDMKKRFVEQCDRCKGIPSFIGGRYEDCWNPVYARKIVLLYMAHNALSGASDETLARIHNGGPQGPRKSETLEYWKRVKQYMK